MEIIQYVNIFQDFNIIEIEHGQPTAAPVVARLGAAAGRTPGSRQMRLAAAAV